MEETTKGDKREGRRRKERYGHYGMGSSHTREASKEEVEGHIRKIKKERKLRRKGWKKQLKELNK